MQFLAPVSDEGGPAGDTGSAMHRAAAEFHRGKSVSDAITVMSANLADYPHADLADAAKLFISYAADPRNANAKIVLVEESVRFTIEPAAYDVTKQPIVVEGTCDQVREIDGKLKLYDIKTSKKPGHGQLRIAAMQAAAYCVGASVKLGKRVDPGALILPRQYPGGPVFWNFAWTFDDTEHILAGIRHAVACIRSGNIYHSPGDDCEWCPGKGPDICLPKLKELKLRLA